MLKFCLKYKNSILALWCTFILLSGVAIIRHISGHQSAVDNSVSVWFMEDDAELKTYEQYHADFGEQEWTILMLEADNVYAPEFLRDLRQIVQRIEALDHVIKVNSIVNIRDNERLPDASLSYAQVYPEDENSVLLSEEQINQFREKLERNPIFHQNLLERGASDRTVLLIQNSNLIHSLEPYRVGLVDGIRRIVSEYSSVGSHALAGTTVVNAELNRASLRDVYIFYTLITVLLVLFGGVLFRNVKDVSILLVVVVGSILPTMGLISALGIPFNMVTVMLPTILIALSVADAVHVIHDFHLEHQSKSTQEAIHASVNQLWKPSLWTSLTTIVGFASFTTSTVYPMFQLGVFASFGIILAWLTTMLLLPQLFLRFWSGKKREISMPHLPKPSWGDRILGIIQNRRAPLILLLLLLLIPASGIIHMDVDTDYTKFFSQSTELTKAYDAIDKGGFAQNPVTIVLEYPEGAYYGNENYHQGLLAFEQEIRTLPEVIKLLSLNDLLIEFDQAFNGNDENEHRFAEYSLEQLSQLLFLAELSGNDDINDFIVEEKDQIQILALTPYMSSKELQNFRSRVNDLKDLHLPSEMQMLVTGTTVLWANMDEQISQTQLLSLGVIATFLVVSLPLIFGSFRLGFVGVILNFLPLGVALGLMSYLGIKVNMATALIGGISLGVVVDDTLHMLFRARIHFKQGMDWSLAVDKALSSVGSSIVTTSIILVGGFLCMATSTFLPTAHFGFFIALAIIVALFLDLFILPILVKTPWLTPGFARRAESTAKDNLKTQLAFSMSDAQ